MWCMQMLALIIMERFSKKKKKFMEKAANK